MNMTQSECLIDVSITEGIDAFMWSTYKFLTASFPSLSTIRFDAASCSKSFQCSNCSLFN